MYRRKKTVNMNTKCQNHNSVVRDVSLEAFAAKELNGMFSGRQQHRAVKVYRCFEPSHRKLPEDGD
jgi:hypothetical protein